MNKSQIRLMLDKEGIKISNTRIGEVAVSLGFGDNVSYNYTDDEAKQIMGAIRDQHPAKSQNQGSQPPTEESQALTKATLQQSTDSLVGQVKALANRIDGNDRTLARELAQYVVARPQRFTVMFAQELSALMAPVQEAPQSFVDVDSLTGDFEVPDLMSDFMAIAPSSAMGCLPM